MRIQSSRDKVPSIFFSCDIKILWDTCSGKVGTVKREVKFVESTEWEDEIRTESRTFDDTIYQDVEKNDLLVERLQSA